MSATAVVIVTGLSGGGKASILRALEDVGYEAVDNPPLTMLEEMVAPSGVRPGTRKLAIGIDARTRGFDAADVLAAIARLRADPELRLQLVYAWADESTLLRRYTETRRRHPLAPQGVVAEGIAAELALTEPLRQGADLVVDTSGLPIANLRRLIERHFGTDADGAQMAVSLMSFAYPKGLPREADLVFDARFLRNPHYDPILRPKTGMSPDVGAYVEADPDFAEFFSRIAELIELVLPRFVQEGKKYATITIGCTGGRHRSVYLIEKLANHLMARFSAGGGDADGVAPWRVSVTHRELSRDDKADAFVVDRPVARRDETDIDTDLYRAAQALSVQA
ncbi:MAG TPA: RNase adapter RapZ [Acetobacteraceae bacterium]|jgi:RNase adapter protein RapZ|nr:RNase adapter RapZ [Acetobacteraceae bacterium]